MQLDRYGVVYLVAPDHPSSLLLEIWGTAGQPIPDHVGASLLPCTVLVHAQTPTRSHHLEAPADPGFWRIFMETIGVAWPN